MMTTTATPSTLDRATTFLESIQKRLKIQFDSHHQLVKDAKQDTGAKAVLKRALTGEPKHLLDVYQIFVACLFAYYPQPLDRDKPRNFGQSAAVLASATNSEGVDRRFRSLLDTSLEDLRSPLSALVRLMKSKDIAINYPKLIVDLYRWEHPDQYIQDQWARAFWGAPELPKETQEAADDVNE
jgi:CRISPR system Cascade subunit CasB